MSAEDKEHEQASLMGRTAKTDEPTYWETYVGYLREFLLYYRPQAIVTLAMTVLFSVAWTVAYGWGISIWRGIHKDCNRPLMTYLGAQGIIGILTLVFVIAVAAYAFTLTYNTRPSKMPDCPQSFIGLFTFTLVMLLLNFTWFVVGTAWMFELGGRTSQHKQPTCNEQLYLFTWWYITAGWMWYIVIAIVGCALSACLPTPKRVDGHLQKGLGADKP